MDFLLPSIPVVLTTIGVLALTKILLSLLQLAYENHLMRGVNLKKYATGNSYAVVTGATDGIGKQFALQLAKLDLNLVLISRSVEKLNQTASEIKALNSKVDVKIFALDFAAAADSDYVALQKFLEDLSVYVLVNNVGTNHSIPTPFIEEKWSTLQSIVNVNITSILRLTHIILPQMTDRRKGLVINVGSFSGSVPTPLLQTYAGSKAFLRHWSESLAAEVKPLGVHVELLNTYFVISNMSKIRRPSLFVPTASSYVKNAMKRIGRYAVSTPYPYHNLMRWAIDTFISRDILVQKTYDMQISVRQRALKKMEVQKEE